MIEGRHVKNMGVTRKVRLKQKQKGSGRLIFEPNSQPKQRAFLEPTELSCITEHSKAVHSAHITLRRCFTATVPLPLSVSLTP